MNRFILSAILILVTMTAYSQQHTDNEALLAPVKQQLEAYNNRDI
ncbi:hypothetical protein [uncultured Pontibacter sp.]|nr:hypothetical protein [uncultured Pontibacter sp.]